MSIRAKLLSTTAFLIAFFVLLSTVVQAALNDSTCPFGISPPAGPIYEGYKYTASVTMENVGDNSWSWSASNPNEGYFLGSSGNNTNWTVSRVRLPSSPIATNQTATFTFDVTVNASPGTYSFSWRMVRDPESTYGFFGATCTASITVLPSPYALYSPLMLKNHPAGYVPDSGKSTENSPYYDTANGSNASEKQWSTVVVNNPGTTPVDVKITLYKYTGGAPLTSFTKNITAGNIWNSYGDSNWSPAWSQSWVTHDQTGTANDSVVGWAKIVPVAAVVGSAPTPVFGQQRIAINEPKTDANGPIPGANHFLTDMGLTGSPSATLNGGYFMRNWPAGYPGDGAVVQKTYMNIANPSNSAANVTMRIYKEDGTLHHTASKTIAAFGSWFAISDPVWETIPFMTTTSKVLQRRQIATYDTFTDNTSEANAPSGTAYDLLDIDVQTAFNTNNGTYFAAGSNFTEANFDIDRAGVGVTLVVQYCSGTDVDSNCNAWTNVSGKSDGTSNGTSSLAQDGKISWTPPAGWTPGKVNGTSAKWLRIRSSTAPTTAPTAFYSTNTNKSLGWIEVTSDQPVTGFNRTVAEKPGDTNWLRLLTDFPLAPPSSSVNLYTSLFVKEHNSGFTAPGTTNHIKQWSYLTLHNPGSTSATATIRVYSTTGTAATPFTKTIASHATWIAKNDTDWNAVNIGTLGWVEVNSTAPLVGVNRVSIGGESSTSHHYWTDYPMDFLGSKKLYSAYFLKDHPSGYWEGSVVQRSYIHIANPSASSATVTIKILKPDGTTHASWTETIASKNSWIAISDTDSDGAGQDKNWNAITGLTYGWVEVSSTQPVVATNRVTFAKSGASSTNWLRLMTDAPLTPPPPASLGVLNVVPDTATLAIQGPAYGRTGLRTTESGSNFYNAIQVTQKAANATTSNVSLVGSAFAAAPPAGGKAYIHSLEGDDPLGILKTRADSTNGFILIYAANDTTHSSGPTATTCDSGATANFCQGKYYVYRGISAGGTWSGALALADSFGIPANGLVVQPKSLPGQTVVTAPTFSVTLYTAINNRSWSTYGYIKNVNGEEKSIVQRSCPATVSDPNSPSYATTCF